MPVRCLRLLNAIVCSLFFVGRQLFDRWRTSPSRTPDAVSLHGAGSTFAAPLYKKWIEVCTRRRSP